jgi:hypothetical protein
LTGRPNEIIKAGFIPEFFRFVVFCGGPLRGRKEIAMGSSSSQALPVPAPDVEKNESVQPVPQPERKDAPFSIKLLGGIPV